MKTIHHISDTDKIRILLTRYFEGTISPIEMDRLESEAHKVASGKAICTDHGIDNDLRLINTISRYAETSLNDFAESLPEGLGERLDSHISMLAAKASSRERRSWLTCLVSYTAAAAVAGVIAIAGFSYLSSDNVTEQPALLIANAPQDEFVTGEQPKPAPALAKATAAKPAIANVSVMGESSPKKKGEDKAGNDVDLFIAEADQALSAIPPIAEDAFSISEEAFRVMPTGVTAYVETSQILTQPISTFSQSINSIYESVEMVSEALSGVSSALEAANNSLALLGDLSIDY